MLRYYGRLLSVAFWHSWSTYEFLCGEAGLLLPLAQKLNPSWDQPSMTELAWQTTACFFGVLFLVRLILAPWWMHKEQEKVIADAQKQLADKANELAERDSRIEVERAAHQDELRRAQTSDPAKNAIRREIEKFVNKFEDLASRASKGPLAADELYGLEIEAQRFFERRFPHYEHFGKGEDRIVNGWGREQMVKSDEASRRCQTRLVRLREALELLS